LRITTGIVAYTPLGKPAESIQSGHYGHPPRAWWWAKQSVIYFCGLFGMKICVLVIFVALPWISRVGDWALRWTEGNEQLQIFFVMMLFPLIMNAMQYYIIDTFIKERTPADADGVRRHAADAEGAYEHLAAASDDDEDDDDGEGGGQRASADELGFTASKGAAGIVHDREYDPTTDGDSPTVVGSSSTQRSRTERVIPKELYPKE
jgi:hypothetical protein